MLPLSLLICLLGFAAGDPILPPWLEIGLVAIAGIAPIAWMQSQKPFCIFSLLAVTLRPERLSEAQRKILAMFLVRRSPIGIGLVALVLTLILRWICTIAPVAEGITPISSHGFGLIVAAIGFFAANLFVQVPLSVFLVMTSSDADIMKLEPIAVDQVSKRFLMFGIPVDQIVPPLEAPKTS